MGYDIASKALWSDVTLVTSNQDCNVFTDWIHAHGMNPDTALVRMDVFVDKDDEGTRLIDVQSCDVWDPSIATMKPSTLPTEVPSTAFKLVRSVDTELLESLAMVLEQAEMMDSLGHVKVQPQSWRVLTHLAYWEDHRLEESLWAPPNSVLHAPYELARCTEPFRTCPLNESEFHRLNEHRLVSRYAASMSSEKYHAWYARSMAQMTDEGHALNAEARAALTEKVTGPWSSQSAEEQQALVQKLFKPHPLHAHVWHQSLEQWHLEKSVGEPHEPVQPNRSRL